MAVIPAERARASMLDISETQIIESIDRSPLEMSLYSGDHHQTEVVFATSEGLLVFDVDLSGARFLVRGDVRSVARDPYSNRWVAAGMNGLWREDVGWFFPSEIAEAEPSSAEIVDLTASPLGLIATSRSGMWLLKGPGLSASRLVTDSGGFFGRPSVTTDEAAAVGFWSLHRIPIPAHDVSSVVDIRIPAELRSDECLGAAHLGRTLVVIGRRSGMYVLSPTDRIFPSPQIPPAQDDAHAAHGFSAGWADFSADESSLYLMTGAAELYQASVGQSTRKISGWPDLDQPYRFIRLADARIVLYPAEGSWILLNEPKDPGRLVKLNFLKTSSGEILVRRGIDPGWLRASGISVGFRPTAGLFGVIAGVIVLAIWSAIYGIPFAYKFHPRSAAFQERLIKFKHDEATLIQSYRRTESEIRRMETGSASSSEERIRSLRESQAALTSSMTQFAYRAEEEAVRIKQEGQAADRPGSVVRRGIWSRILHSQTRGWEKQFMKISQNISNVIAGSGGSGGSAK